MLSKLRNHINVVEMLMANNRFDDINFSFEDIKNNNYAQIKNNSLCVNDNGQNILHLSIIYKNAHIIDWICCNFKKEILDILYKSKDNFDKIPSDYAENYYWKITFLEI